MRRRSKRLAGAGSGDEEALLGGPLPSGGDVGAVAVLWARRAQENPPMEPVLRAASERIDSAVERLIAHRIRALLATQCVPRIQDRSKHVQEPKIHFREVTVRTLRDRGFHDRAVHRGMIQ